MTEIIVTLDDNKLRLDTGSRGDIIALTRKPIGDDDSVTHVSYTTVTPSNSMFTVVIVDD